MEGTWRGANRALLEAGRCGSAEGSGSGRLDAPNRGDAIDRAVERRDRLYAAGLCAGDEVGLGEINSADLVDLKRAQEERRVDDDDRWEPDHSTGELCDPLPADLVETLADEDHFGDDQVGHQQLIGGRQEGSR